jgi:hypothetical protein
MHRAHYIQEQVLFWQLDFQNKVIVVGLRGPRATHITGYCCLFMWGLGQHTILGLMWAFSNGFKIICFDGVDVSISVSPPKPLKQITPSQTKSCATTPYFLINLLFKLATIRQISYSQTCTFP